MLGLIVGVIIALLSAGGWYLWGVELDLVTDSAGAVVVLDGKPVGRTIGQPGVLILPHLTHGVHSLTLTHPEFDEWAQPVELGWLEFSHSLKVALPIPKYPLTILTNPGGTRVQLDGQDAGVSDEVGNLVIQKVPRGQHVVTATRDGFPGWSGGVWVGSPSSIRVDLAEMAARRQQEITSHLERAQSLYQQREYPAAIAECDAILNLDPANQQAAALKAQIQQTMSILGGR